MLKLSPFANQVVTVVRSIPYGKVVSYGQVAAYVGMPRGARQVGWTLRRLEKVDMPWWRVINNQGHISIAANWLHDRDEQRDLLRQEAVEVGTDYSVNMIKYRYHFPVNI